MAKYEQKREKRNESKTDFRESRMSDRDRKPYSSYDECINAAKRARNSQRNDTNPMIEKEGFLGMDDIDRMRRRKIDNPETVLL